MHLFPLYTSLKNKCVLVVGGGDIAERKIELMLQAGARVRVVSPVFTEALEARGRCNDIELIRQRFDPELVNDAWFVIAATNLPEVNADVAQAAQARRRFVNVVDDPELSSVHIPAIVDRSPLMISISSSGCAPMIARHVREQVETLVDDAMGHLTALVQTYRPDIRRHRPCLPERRQFYEWLIRGPVLQLIRAGNDTAAAQCLLQALQNKNTPMPGHTTHIAITSDKPGDITLHTLRALNQADIIFYDERVHTNILNLARRDADRHSFTATQPAAEASVPDFIVRETVRHTKAGRVSVVLALAASHASISGLTEGPAHVPIVPKIPDTTRSGLPVIP